MVIRFNPFDPLGILGSVKHDVDRIAGSAKLPVPPSLPGLTTKPSRGNPIEDSERLQSALRLSGFTGPSLVTQLVSEIQQAVKDESVGFDLYTMLAQRADELGQPQIANSLRAIARDEQQHRLTLEGILIGLQQAK